MKTLFNNLLSKILACTLVAAVSMPTPAFSATSGSHSSFLKELQARGVRLYCEKDIKLRYEFALLVENPLARSMRVIEEIMGQCELIDNNNIASGKKILESAKEKGSVVASYLLLQVRYSEQKYIDKNEFRIFYDRAKQMDLSDNYFLHAELVNRTVLGSLHLVYLFGEEILAKEQEDNINGYLSIIKQMFNTLDSPSCEGFINDMANKVERPWSKLDKNSYLHKHLDDYKGIGEMLKKRLCPRLMQTTEKIKAKAEEKGITIE